MAEFEDYTLIAFINALKGTLDTTIEADGVISTPAQALAGTNNTTIMTPLRVAQAISNVSFTFAPLAQAVPTSNAPTGWFLGKGSTGIYDFEWQEILLGGTVNAVAVATANGFAGTSDGDPTTPTLTLSTTVTGILKGNGTAISAAVAGTDYVVPTRAINTGTGLTGGGNLTADRTIALDAASITSLLLADSAVQSVVAGSNITVDSTDPQNPIISASSGGGPSVNSQASAASITPDVDTYNVYALTAQAANLTINAPTGTPVDGQQLTIRVRDDGTTRTLTWNAAFVEFATDQLPATTVINKTHYFVFWWNAATSVWELVTGNPLAGLWA